MAYPSSSTWLSFLTESTELQTLIVALQMKKSTEVLKGRVFEWTGF